MPLLRPSELARIWELHPKTVYLWIREGKLPAIKTPGAQYRIRAGDARAYCEKNSLADAARHREPGGERGGSREAQRVAARAREGVQGARHRRRELAVGPRGPARDRGRASGRGGDRRQEIADVKVLTDAVRALRKTARTAKVPLVVFDVAPRAGTDDAHEARRELRS